MQLIDRISTCSAGLRVSFLRFACVTCAILTGHLRAAADPGYVPHRFPDFNLAYKPPEQEYDGPLFRLSQEYPDVAPHLDSDLKRILGIDFTEKDTAENWMTYLLAVRDYCFAGNLEVEWRGQENSVRAWYHVPWQHYGEKGREGIHGLTREATAKPRQLAASQLRPYQTHAVALYNAQGGFTIGQVWNNQFEPDPTLAHFPEGTVVAKVLFTQASESEVPYLSNPLSWKAYVQSQDGSSKRTVQELHLIQMDVMIRDRRADAFGGWVFGTFCYNGNLASANPWYNLVPVGIQWGNDERVSSLEDNPVNPEAVVTIINQRLNETRINPSKDLPAQHLGWGGRLNGPVDYYRSSCMSCHSTAQYPVVAPQHPDFDKTLGYVPGSKEWTVWFRNLACGESFSPNEASRGRAMSMDFSLQLAIGIDNFFNWKSAAMSGYFTPILPGAQPRARVKTFVPTSEIPHSTHGE